MKHAMTIGELALLFNDEYVPLEKESGGRKAWLQVVQMQVSPRVSPETTATRGEAEAQAEISHFLGRRQPYPSFRAPDVMTDTPTPFSFLQNWERRMRFRDAGLPWVSPSPNLPTLASVSLYVGTGLVEGVNLSEGRGTTLPFELIGAAFLDWRFADRMRQLSHQDPGLSQVRFREAYYTPTFSKFANQTCAGVQVRRSLLL